jgi:16S rRNA (guanine527-N7)-methyltransferase
VDPFDRERSKRDRGPDKLGRYRQLLTTYRDTLNLVSPANPKVIDELLTLSQSYADLLSEITKSGDVIADVGSGAGIPAIVVAIELPDRGHLLIERRRRRATFLRLAIAHLDLRGVAVHEAEAASVTGQHCQAITAQSVMPFDQLYCLTTQLHAEEVTLIGRKGAGWRAELDALERRTGWQGTDVRERRLEPHGSLIALRLPGGRTCRSSASSTKKGA